MPSPIFIFRHPQRILSSFPFFFPFPFQKEWKRGRKRCVASRNNGPSISTDFSRHGTRVFSPLLPPLLHPQTLEILSSKEYIMEHIYRINPLSSKFFDTLQQGVAAQRVTISIEIFQRGEDAILLKDFFPPWSGGGRELNCDGGRDAGAATPASAIATSPWIPGRRKVAEAAAIDPGPTPRCSLLRCEIVKHGGILFFPSFFPFLPINPRRISLIALSLPLVVVLVVLVSIIQAKLS